MRHGHVGGIQLATGGRRLTASYFLPEDLEAARLLDSSPCRRDQLSDLCRPDGIFRGPIFRRIPASDETFGRPYVKPSQLERVDIGVNRYLSLLHGELLEHLALEEGMILVTCSGKSLGKVLFARADLQGLVASHDLIRVAPDAERVHPGYLLAYLASPIGRVVIRRQIYGTSVVHVEPEHLFDLPVLRLDRTTENRIGEAVMRAQGEISVGIREFSLLSGRKPRPDLAGRGHEPKLPWTLDESPVGGGRIGQVSSADVSRPGRRLTASYFLPRDVAAARALDESTLGRDRLADLCEQGGIYKGPIFKRVMALDEGHGRPYVMPSQLERLEVGVRRYLSKAHGELLSELEIRHPTILITRSGKSLGKVLFVRPDLDGLVASDDLIRVVADPEKVHPGYLLAYLASRVGKVVVSRQVYGTSVVHIEPEHLFDLPVLRIGREREQSMGDAVLRAQAKIAGGIRGYAHERARVLASIETAATEG